MHCFQLGLLQMPGARWKWILLIRQAAIVQLLMLQLLHFIKHYLLHRLTRINTMTFRSSSPRRESISAAGDKPFFWTVQQYTSLPKTTLRSRKWKYGANRKPARKRMCLAKLHSVSVLINSICGRRKRNHTLRH